MNRKRKLALLWGLIGVASACFFIGLAYPHAPLNSKVLQSQSLNPQQQSFVVFMVPKIDSANQQVFALRQRIIAIKQKNKLSNLDRRFLIATATSYKVPHFKLDDPASMTELLKRVDIVPTSLVLAQAANESGWGASRFAKRADNFFGQHCYTKGCGIVPASGDTTFEVQKFHNAQDAINYYLYNLNSNSSYASFRDARAQLRAAGKSLTGPNLVPYLVNYSQLGEGYISMINSMILAHGFSQYDEKY
jgi:Bax protein